MGAPIRVVLSTVAHNIAAVFVECSFCGQYGDDNGKYCNPLKSGLNCQKWYVRNTKSLFI